MKEESKEIKAKYDQKDMIYILAEEYAKKSYQGENRGIFLARKRLFEEYGEKLLSLTNKAESKSVEGLKAEAYNDGYIKGCEDTEANFLMNK